ncbi:MAG: histidine kinase [Reichenbachiella sp.]
MDSYTTANSKDKLYALHQKVESSLVTGGWRYDFDGQVVWTEQSNKIWNVEGKTPPNITSFLKHVNESDREKLEAAFKACEENAIEFELYVLKNDNTTILIKGEPIKENEIVIGIQGIFSMQPEGEKNHDLKTAYYSNSSGYQKLMEKIIDDDSKSDIFQLVTDIFVDQLDCDWVGLSCFNEPFVQKFKKEIEGSTASELLNKNEVNVLSQKLENILTNDSAYGEVEEQIMDEVNSCGLESLIVFPISFKAKRYGCLYLCAKQKSFFTPDKINFINQISEGLGYGLELIRIRSEAFEAWFLVNDQVNRDLAKELHDGLGQSLTVISLNLGGISRGLKLSSPKHKVLLDEANQFLKIAVDQTQQLTNSLFPRTLIDFGLVSGIKSEIKRLETKKGVQIIFEHDFSHRIPDSRIELNIFHIVKEALNHAINLSQPSGIDLTLYKRKDIVSLEISTIYMEPIPQETSKNDTLQISLLRNRVSSILGVMDIKISEVTRVIFIEVPNVFN